MGVRGLTTFIANRSRQYLEHYELHDSYLVIDGNSIASQLYKWHLKSNDCFGGDYDKYAHVIYNFFQLLSDCNVTPLVILDGAYEKRKLKTVYNRMKNKIAAAKALNSVTEDKITLFPLFLRELFVDILLKLQIQCVRCDFEGDHDAAHLARTLQCPIVSYDSDFYIFDVLYIPFSNMDLKLRRKNKINYIACDIYRIEKFLNSFGGLDRVHLPLLAVLLGNDYIKKRAFSAFYRQLKIQKTKYNEQQTQIKSVIVWLKNESPDSALRKILGRFKLRYRRRLTKMIERAIEAYQCGNTPVCSYFNIDETNVDQLKITVPKAEEVEDLSEEDDNEDDVDDDDDDDDDVDEIDLDEDEDEQTSEIPEEMAKSEDENLPDEGQISQEKKTFKYNIPDFFRENFRKCLYPSAFMDIVSSNTYFCIQQIEDFPTEHSHAISFEILSAISKILTVPKTRRLMCVARHGYSHIKRSSLPLHQKELPTLSDIETLEPDVCRSTFLEILNIPDNTFHMFPNSWQLFLISIKYWVSQSKNKVDLAYISSLVLCGIVLNYVDTKVGFYRSTKSFLAKYSTNTNNPNAEQSTPKNISAALDDLDLPESVSCMKKLIHYFQMDAKMKTYFKLFDRSIVHEFAKFQSCFLHIKYLNSLLKFPFPNVLISEFYDGTFLYNMTTNLQKRTDLRSYVKLLLEDCPKIYSIYELMVEEIEIQIGENVGREPLKKRRRRKKKAVQAVVPEAMDCDSGDEEEFPFDANNKFSLLNFINK